MDTSQEIGSIQTSPYLWTASLDFMQFSYLQRLSDLIDKTFKKPHRTVVFIAGVTFHFFLSFFLFTYLFMHSFMHSFIWNFLNSHFDQLHILQTGKQTREVK